MNTSAAMVHADAEVLLDLEDLRAAPTSAEGLAELWAGVESALVGRDLGTRRVHKLEAASGVVRFEVVRAAPDLRVVGPHTRFSIVGVRETAKVNYRCRRCTAQGTVTYGPFVCRACGTDDLAARVCDRHVSILDGALIATCDEHRPGCRECGLPATFRCAGPRCRHDDAWCEAHRRPHPRDTDIDHCPSCHDVLFPRCESADCTDIGSVRCEHVGEHGRQCVMRMCTRHACRWQVYGGERLGLARCVAHQNVSRLTPDEILHQIVAGTARRRRERMPSLQGFAHNVRRVDPELALAYDDLFRRLEAVGNRCRDEAAVRSAIGAARSAWQRQLARVSVASADGQLLLERLRAVVRSTDPSYGHAIAEGISLAEYKAPRTVRGEARPGMLFVRVPEALRGLFIGPKGSRIRYYSEQLEVVVKIEGNQAKR